MGTSVNQASPNTPLWVGVNETYKQQDIPIERVVQELWRASNSDPEGLASQLCGSDIHQILRVSLAYKEPALVSKALSDAMYENPNPSIATQIACRAAVQSCNYPDRAVGFVARLFSEASNYLVARDLPGAVGLGTRLPNVPAAFEFKTNVVRSVGEMVGNFAEERTSTERLSTSEDWANFSKGMVAFLARIT